MRLATEGINALTEEQIRLARHFRQSTLSTGAGTSAVADDNDDREQVLRALMNAHGRTVRAVLARSERSRDDVDELWADVFLLAYRAVAATLQRLRPVDRQVLVLDALGHDGPSIGRQLGISAGAARKRLMVARIAFRQQFGALADGAIPGGTQARTER